jgi:hypothetical protein
MLVGSGATGYRDSLTQSQKWPFGDTSDGILDTQKLKIIAYIFRLPHVFERGRDYIGIASIDGSALLTYLNLFLL